MDWKVLQTQQLTGGWWMCGRGDSRPEASTEPTLVFTSPPSRGRDGSGEGHWGVYFGEVGDDCAAPAALLVSSVAADACSATALHHQHPIQGGSSGLGVFSSLSQQGPGAHQWCLCCSSGGHLLAESESRSTLGMELSSPRYQDCGERRKDGERPLTIAALLTATQRSRFCLARGGGGVNKKTWQR